MNVVKNEIKKSEQKKGRIKEETKRSEEDRKEIGYAFPLHCLYLLQANLLFN